MHLMIIAGTFVVLAGIGIAIWGFPAETTFVMLLPALVIGGTIAHVRGAVRRVHNLRPGILAIGAVLGGFFLVVTYMLYAAATSPVQTVVRAERVIEAPPELVWRTAGSLDQRTRWHTWLKSIGDGEILPQAPDEGEMFKATVNVGGRKIPVEQTTTAYEPPSRWAWTVKFPGGTEIDEFTEEITLAETGDGDTRVTYTITYMVPTVTGRLFNNLSIVGGFRAVTQASVDQLAQVVAE